MTVKNLLNTKIQVFNTINEPVPNQIMTTKEALEYGLHYKGLIDKTRSIATVDDLKYKELKSRMFVWLPTALVKNNKSNIVHTYPILCIDIDYKDNPDIDIELLKDQLISLPFIYYVGLSIGGKGLFALAYIEDINYYEEHFNAMKDYMKKHLCVNIDPQCGNKNRLRFMSYDDNPRIKDENIEIKPFTELKWKQPDFLDTTLQLSLFSKPKKEYPDLLEDDNFCYAVVDFCIDNLNYTTGGRTTGWIQDLSACKSLINGEELALRISRQSQNYKSDEDVRQVFHHKGTFTNRTGLTKFFKLCKDYFSSQNKNWIYTIKELYELD